MLLPCPLFLGKGGRRGGAGEAPRYFGWCCFVDWPLGPLGHQSLWMVKDIGKSEPRASGVVGSWVVSSVTGVLLLGSLGLGAVIVLDICDGLLLVGDAAFPLVLLCGAVSSLLLLWGGAAFPSCVVLLSLGVAALSTFFWVLLAFSLSILGVAALSTFLSVLRAFSLSLLGVAALSTSFLWVLRAFSLSLVGGGVLPFSFCWVVKYFSNRLVVQGRHDVRFFVARRVFVLYLWDGPSDHI